MKMLTDLGSADGPVTGSQTAFSHCVLTWWEEQGSAVGLSSEGSSPIPGGPTLMPSSPPKIPSSNTVALGMRGSTYKLCVLGVGYSRSVPGSCKY